MNKLLASVVTIATVGFATPALASAPRYFEYMGHTGSVVDNGEFNYDYITLSGPAGHTQLKVMCTGGGGNEWTSYGTFTDDLNQAVANSWCRSF